MTAKGRRWRLAATAAALSVLVYGQIADTNDLFPLGSLSQYASPHDLNGVVRALYLEADVEGQDEPVTIRLDQWTVGLGRGEIENQLWRFREDPGLLQELADAHAALRPDRPQPTHLYLRRTVRQLENGVPVGVEEIVTVAEWAVQSPGGSP